MKDPSPPGSTPRSSDNSWIDCLASALPKLAQIQEPYLQAYQEQNPQVHSYSEREETPPRFPLDDLRMLYSSAYHSSTFGNAKYYAHLRDVLDPVRHIIRSHPTLIQVVSPIIGKDEFWMQVLNSGLSTSPSNLIAGLMAREAELSGDSYRLAAEDLNRLLTPMKVEDTELVPGELDVGYDAVLFYGLTLNEQIDLDDGMIVLTFEQTQRFVEPKLVEELAPFGAGFHKWRSVGAVVRPFRWRPEFRRRGNLQERALSNPMSFFKDALRFLDLIGVAHTTPVPLLAMMTNCIDRSASRLLGLANPSVDLKRGRPVHSLDGIDKCPEPAPEALAEAINAFKNRKGDRYAKVAWMVSRLSDALINDGRFSDEDRIVTVVKTLERMYDLPDRGISSELQNRASKYLGVDVESRECIKDIIKQSYDSRSSITHGWVENLSLESKTEVFDNGFQIARRTLFKLLQDGPPENWDNMTTSDA